MYISYKNGYYTTYVYMLYIYKSSETEAQRQLSYPDIIQRERGLRIEKIEEKNVITEGKKNMASRSMVTILGSLDETRQKDIDILLI